MLHRTWPTTKVNTVQILSGNGGANSEAVFYYELIWDQFEIEVLIFERHINDISTSGLKPLPSPLELPQFLLFYGCVKMRRCANVKLN